MARGRGSGDGSAADVGTAGTAGRGGSRVGGSGKEWSFGFSVVVGRTIYVWGTKIKKMVPEIIPFSFPCTSCVCTSCVCTSCT